MAEEEEELPFHFVSLSLRNMNKINAMKTDHNLPYLYDAVIEFREYIEEEKPDFFIELNAEEYFNINDDRELNNEDCLQQLYYFKNKHIKLFFEMLKISYGQMRIDSMLKLFDIDKKAKVDDLPAEMKHSLPRIKNILKQLENNKIVLVCGPPKSGKKTLCLTHLPKSNKAKNRYPGGFIPIALHDKNRVNLNLKEQIDNYFEKVQLKPIHKQIKQLKADNQKYSLIYPRVLVIIDTTALTNALSVEEWETLLRTCDEFKVNCLLISQSQCLWQEKDKQEQMFQTIQLPQGFDEEEATLFWKNQCSACERQASDEIVKSVYCHDDEHSFWNVDDQFACNCAKYSQLGLLLSKKFANNPLFMVKIEEMLKEKRKEICSETDCEKLLSKFEEYLITWTREEWPKSKFLNPQCINIFKEASQDFTDALVLLFDHSMDISIDVLAIVLNKTKENIQEFLTNLCQHFLVIKVDEYSHSKQPRYKLPFILSINNLLNSKDEEKIEKEEKEKMKEYQKTLANKISIDIKNQTNKIKSDGDENNKSHFLNQFQGKQMASFWKILFQSLRNQFKSSKILIDSTNEWFDFFKDFRTWCIASTAMKLDDLKNEIKSCSEERLFDADLKATLEEYHRHLGQVGKYLDDVEANNDQQTFELAQLALLAKRDSHLYKSAKAICDEGGFYWHVYDEETCVISHYCHYHCVNDMAAEFSYIGHHPSGTIHHIKSCQSKKSVYENKKKKKLFGLYYCDASHIVAVRLEENASFEFLRVGHAFEDYKLQSIASIKSYFKSEPSWMKINYYKHNSNGKEAMGLCLVKSVRNDCFYYARDNIKDGLFGGPEQLTFPECPGEIMLDFHLSYSKRFLIFTATLTTVPLEPHLILFDDYQKKVIRKVTFNRNSYIYYNKKLSEYLVIITKIDNDKFVIKSYDLLLKDVEVELIINKEKELENEKAPEKIKKLEEEIKTLKSIKEDGLPTIHDAIDHFMEEYRSYLRLLPADSSHPQNEKRVYFKMWSVSCRRYEYYCKKIDSNKQEGQKESQTDIKIKNESVVINQNKCDASRSVYDNIPNQKKENHNLEPQEPITIEEEFYKNQWKRICCYEICDAKKLTRLVAVNENDQLILAVVQESTKFIYQTSPLSEYYNYETSTFGIDYNYFWLFNCQNKSLGIYWIGEVDKDKMEPPNGKLIRLIQLEGFKGYELIDKWRPFLVLSEEEPKGVRMICCLPTTIRSYQLTSTTAVEDNAAEQKLIDGMEIKEESGNLTTAPNNDSTNKTNDDNTMKYFSSLCHSNVLVHLLMNNKKVIELKIFPSHTNLSNFKQLKFPNHSQKSLNNEKLNFNFAAFDDYLAICFFDKLVIVSKKDGNCLLGPVSLWNKKVSSQTVLSIKNIDCNKPQSKKDNSCELLIRNEKCDSGKSLLVQIFDVEKHDKYINASVRITETKQQQIEETEPITIKEKFDKNQWRTIYFKEISETKKLTRLVAVDKNDQLMLAVVDESQKLQTPWPETEVLKNETSTFGIDEINDQLMLPVVDEPQKLICQTPWPNTKVLKNKTSTFGIDYNYLWHFNFDCQLLEIYWIGEIKMAEIEFPKAKFIPIEYFEGYEPIDYNWRPFFVQPLKESNNVRMIWSFPKTIRSYPLTPTSAVDDDAAEQTLFIVGKQRNEESGQIFQNPNNDDDKSFSSLFHSGFLIRLLINNKKDIQLQIFSSHANSGEFQLLEFFAIASQKSSNKEKLNFNFVAFRDYLAICFFDTLVIASKNDGKCLFGPVSLWNKNLSSQTVLPNSITLSSIRSIDILHKPEKNDDQSNYYELLVWGKKIDSVKLLRVQIIIANEKENEKIILIEDRQLLAQTGGNDNNNKCELMLDDRDELSVAKSTSGKHWVVRYDNNVYATYEIDESAGWEKRLKRVSRCRLPQTVALFNKEIQVFFC